MLVLTRKLSQKIVLPAHQVTITVLAVQGNGSGRISAPGKLRWSAKKC